MERNISLLLVITLLWAGQWGRAQAESLDDTEYTVEPATLTVRGHGEVSAAPDRAILRLGVVAQAAKASEAQDRVNPVVQNIIKNIKLLGVAEQDITTIDLSIYPVYGNQHPEPQDQTHPPAIHGYRASNIIRIQIDSLGNLGGVIDAGLDAGANRIEGLSFELKDDGDSRKQALRLAAGQAAAKANAIAQAMGVEVIGIKQVSEAGVNLTRPQMDSGPVFSARAAATPVQAGQVRVEASLTVCYYIADIEPPGPDDSTITSALSK